MLIHPNIDPIAFSIGPLAVRWYGLMYLAGFAVGWWLGVRRIDARPGAGHARAARRPAVLRRARRDPRRAPGLRAVLQAGVLPRAPARDLLHLAGRHVVPRRLPRRDGRRWRFAARQHASTGCALMDFIAPLVPLGPRRRAPGQLHQRRAAGAASPTCPGAWCSAAPATRRAIRRSSTSSRSRAWRCSSLLWWFSSQAAAARRRCRRCSCIGYGVFRFLAEFAREPDAFLGFLALGLTMGQWLCLPMIAGGVALFAVESALDPVLGAVLPVFGLVALRAARRAFRPGHAGVERSAEPVRLRLRAAGDAVRRGLPRLARRDPERLLPRRGRRRHALHGARRLRRFRAACRRPRPPESIAARPECARSPIPAILGIPLVTVAYGERAALPAALATVATNLVFLRARHRLPRAVDNPRGGGVLQALARRRPQPAHLADRACRAARRSRRQGSGAGREASPSLLAGAGGPVRAVRHRPVRLAAVDPRRRRRRLAQHRAQARAASGAHGARSCSGCCRSIPSGQ